MPSSSRGVGATPAARAARTESTGKAGREIRSLAPKARTTETKESGNVARQPAPAPGAKMREASFELGGVPASTGVDEMERRAGSHIPVIVWNRSIANQNLAYAA